MVSLYADGGALDSQTTETHYVDGLSELSCPFISRLIGSVRN
jgi:hypothetical protein